MDNVINIFPAIEAKEEVCQKKLTATPRATYEGHKNALKQSPLIEKQLPTIDLKKVKKYSIETPEEYVKKITIEEDIALGKFLEKIITLGSSQGLICFMMLYQYMYDHNLLGKEIERLTGQEIIDHLYREKSYKLKPKNRTTLLSSIIQLSGLTFCLESQEVTEKIRKKRGFETDKGFKHFTLLKVEEHTETKDGKYITSIGGVSIMKDFINLWYKKISRLYIPLEDILKISSDHNGDHRRGFNLSLALRQAELGNKKDTLEWTLEQCINVGQWQPDPKERSRIWNQIIESLNAGKKQGLIDYHFSYKANKPAQPRYIEKVVIKRLWQTSPENLNIGFAPENLKPMEFEVLSFL